ncbi:hypothetical protein B0H14DRAFT_2636989 [Mycena olivaceomarginata]|nr:hypothetical protein B0H14DRAFT_2636989 [Mycena olivaceomarginata]
MSSGGITPHLHGTAGTDLLSKLDRTPPDLLYSGPTEEAGQAGLSIHALAPRPIVSSPLQVAGVSFGVRPIRALATIVKAEGPGDDDEALGTAERELLRHFQNHSVTRAGRVRGEGRAKGGEGIPGWRCMKCLRTADTLNQSDDGGWSSLRPVVPIDALSLSFSTSGKEENSINILALGSVSYPHFSHENDEDTRSRCPFPSRGRKHAYVMLTDLGRESREGSVFSARAQGRSFFVDVANTYPIFQFPLQKATIMQSDCWYHDIPTLGNHVGVFSSSSSDFFVEYLVAVLSDSAELVARVVDVENSPPQREVGEMHR